MKINRRSFLALIGISTMTTTAVGQVVNMKRLPTSSYWSRQEELAINFISNWRQVDWVVSLGLLEPILGYACLRYLRKALKGTKQKRLQTILKSSTNSGAVMVMFDMSEHSRYKKTFNEWFERSPPLGKKDFVKKVIAIVNNRIA